MKSFNRLRESQKIPFTKENFLSIASFVLTLSQVQAKK